MIPTLCCKYQHVPCAVPFQSATTSVTIKSTTLTVCNMNSALGSPSVIDRGCGGRCEKATKNKHTFALPSSELLFPCGVSDMSPGKCVMVVFQLLCSRYAQQHEHASLWHIFPLRLTQCCDWQVLADRYLLLGGQVSIVCKHLQDLDTYR